MLGLGFLEILIFLFLDRLGRVVVFIGFLILCRESGCGLVKGSLVIEGVYYRI